MRFTLIAVLVFCLVAFVYGDKHEEKKHDYHEDFDYLLMREIEDKVGQLEYHLYYLNRQVEELEKTKSKDLKEKILREITIADNYLKGAISFLERQSRRKDLDLFEKYNFDVAFEGAKILMKDLEHLGKKVLNIETN